MHELSRYLDQKDVPTTFDHAQKSIASGSAVTGSAGQNN